MGSAVLLDHLDELSSSISSLLTLFDCPICLDMLKDPVRTKCGHIFCKMCIHRALRKLTEEPCPNCKTMLKRNRRNIFQDDTMSVFMGLVIELISSINAEIGFDITTYHSKPVSSYEASLNSEEFVNMKSNNVVAQKFPDDSDILMTSRSPLIETISGINEQNIGALNEKVKKSKNMITALVKSKLQTVEKRPRVENNPKVENKILLFDENLPEKGSSSNTKNVKINLCKEPSKENLKDSNVLLVTSSKRPIEKGGELKFLKPNFTKSILKRKHCSSSDDLIKAATATNRMNRVVIVNDDVEKVEENEKKKKKTSVEEDKKKNKFMNLVESKENKIGTVLIGEDTEESKKILLEGEKVEIEDGRKEMEFKVSSDEGTCIIKKSISGPSHVNQGYINKIKIPSCSDVKSTSIRNRNRGIKKTCLKKTVQSRVTRPLKSVARRTAKFAGNSTFIPKKLNDKTAKFYFVTSLVMEKCGRRPVSLMKRKYAVPTKSSDSVENLLKISNTTMEDSIKDSNLPTRKSYSSVSLQTSPIKSIREDCDNSAKNHPIEDFEKSANVDDAKVNTNNLELNINDLGKTTIVRKRDITNSTNVRERSIGNPTIDCGVDIENDSAKDKYLAQYPMNVSQEEMDIFELPASSEKEEQSSKLEKNSDEKADELNETDSDLTQVNPYIKNRNNVCRRRRRSRPARFADFIVNGEPRCVSAKKLVKTNTEKLNEPSTSGASEKLMSIENSNTPKRKAEKNSNSSSSVTKRGGKKMNSTEKTNTEKNSHPNSPFLNSGVKKLIFTEKSITPQRKTEKNVHSSCQFINSGGKKLISIENSNTPQRTTEKNVHSSSPFVNSGGKKLISSENTVPVKESTGRMKTPVSKQLRSPQMSSKGVDHGVMNINRNVSKIVEEGALNKNQVCASVLSGHVSQMDGVIPSSDDFRFSQLTGQSVGNTQRRQMNTAFFGSNSSELVVSQQMASKEQLSDVKEAPLVIDGSDDEEIPQTPNKAEKSIILSQLNSSKLDCSLSDRSFIPSSLDISQMASTSARVQECTGSLKKRLPSTSSKVQKMAETSTPTTVLKLTGSSKTRLPEMTSTSSKVQKLAETSTSNKVKKLSETSTSTTVQKLTEQLPEEENERNIPVEATLVDNPVVIEEVPKKYSFVYSRLALHLLEKLKEFASKINAQITNNITEETTHIILAPGSDNRAIITYKFLKGVAMKLWVVNFDWVLKSLENDKVQPEELFLTLDPVGEPGPRRCKFEDNLPLSNFIIVAMPPYGAINDEQLKELIVLCGGRLVERIEDLPEFEQSKPRILLTDGEIEQTSFESYLENDLIIPLRVDWIIDCIGAYRVVSVLPHLHHPLSNPEILLYLGLSEDMIQDESDESDCDEE